MRWSNLVRHGLRGVSLGKFYQIVDPGQRWVLIFEENVLEDGHIAMVNQLWCQYQPQVHGDRMKLQGYKAEVLRSLFSFRAFKAETDI